MNHSDAEKYDDCVVLKNRITLLEHELEQARSKKVIADAFLCLTRSINEPGDFDERVAVLMKELAGMVQAERSSLFLLAGRHMGLMLRTRFAEGLEGGIELDLQMGIIGASILSNRVVNISDAYSDPRFNASVDAVRGARTESLLCIPICDQDGEVVGAVEMLADQTGAFSGEDEQQGVRCIKTLLKVENLLARDVAHLQEFVKGLQQNISFSHCTVFVIDHDHGQLIPLVAHGADIEDLHLNVKLGIAGIVAITGEEIVVLDAYNDKRFNRDSDKENEFRTEQLICVPLKKNTGEVIAVIQVINKKSGFFDESDLALLKAVSPLLSMYVEKTLLLEEYTLQFRSVLEVMGASIDAKDPLTASHSRKVMDYSDGIARVLGMDEQERDILTVAALLHDYGKLGTRESVLTKSGSLTSDEFNHIKEHAANTRIILDKMYFAPRYRCVPLIASSHHEWLDGTGYSGMLTGENIPFMAKIIAVADVFDALTAKRHYREAMTVKEAFALLWDGVGTQFDKKVVQAMETYWLNEGALQNRLIV